MEKKYVEGKTELCEVLINISEFHINITYKLMSFHKASSLPHMELLVVTTSLIPLLKLEIAILQLEQYSWLVF